MDSVRFGRVLGQGARMAAKTLAGAVDAATAPNPSARAGDTVGEKNVGAGAPTARSADLAGNRPVAAAGEVLRNRGAGSTMGAGKAAAAGKAARAAAQVRGTSQGLRRGGQRFGEAAWGPVVRLSGVLWLEVTGVFFGLFALSAGVGAWKMRGALRLAAGAAGNARAHFLVALAVALVFGYFCVSSFVKAHRRERGR